MDHHPCLTNDMNSPKVTGVRRPKRGQQPGPYRSSSPLVCSPIARAQNMFKRRKHQRTTLSSSMEDQVIMTHAKKTNDKPRNEELLCLAPWRLARGLSLPTRQAPRQHELHKPAAPNAPASAGANPPLTLMPSGQGLRRLPCCCGGRWQWAPSPWPPAAHARGAGRPSQRDAAYPLP